MTRSLSVRLRESSGVHHPEVLCLTLVLWVGKGSRVEEASLNRMLDSKIHVYQVIRSVHWISLLTLVTSSHSVCLVSLCMA